MMNTDSPAERFKEVILNGRWIANTNYRDQLENLPWEIATQKFDGLNTIADLAQHIHYYIKGINNVFKGGALEIRDKFSFDFPPIVSQQQWDGFLTQFWDDSEAFAQFIEDLSDEKQAESFVDEKYGTYRRNIEGMIEHSYYHLGQIVLIKKILLAEK